MEDMSDVRFEVGRYSDAYDGASDMVAGKSS